MGEGTASGLSALVSFLNGAKDGFARGNQQRTEADEGGFFRGLCRWCRGATGVSRDRAHGNGRHYGGLHNRLGHGLLLDRYGSGLRCLLNGFRLGTEDALDNFGYYEYTYRDSGYGNKDIVEKKIFRVNGGFLKLIDGGLAGQLDFALKFSLTLLDTGQAVDFGCFGQGLSVFGFTEKDVDHLVNCRIDD